MRSSARPCSFTREPGQLQVSRSPAAQGAVPVPSARGGRALPAARSRGRAGRRRDVPRGGADRGCPGRPGRDGGRRGLPRPPCGGPAAAAAVDEAPARARPGAGGRKAGAAAAPRAARSRRGAVRGLGRDSSARPSGAHRPAGVLELPAGGPGPPSREAGLGGAAHRGVLRARGPALPGGMRPRVPQPARGCSRAPAGGRPRAVMRASQPLCGTAGRASWRSGSRRPASGESTGLRYGRRRPGTRRSRSRSTTPASCWPGPSCRTSSRCWTCWARTRQARSDCAMLRRPRAPSICCNI